EIDAGTGPSGLPTFELFLPTATLVNYSGGSINSVTKPGDVESILEVPQSNGFTEIITLSQGSLSPSTTAVPEPSTLTLLSLGSLSLLGYGWRRRKQVAA